LLENPDIQLIIIATRHHTHAELAVDAITHGKHVFVEKPLAITRDQLAAVGGCLANHPDRILMVGFNRRFAPLIVRMRHRLANRSQPVCAVYTVNAGFVPPNHWVHDPQIGGGRIIGEGCHFIDTLRFLVNQPIVGVSSRMLGATGRAPIRDDNMSILLEFADGSLGVVHYFANGSKRFPKERIEVFGDGKILVLDNFKRLTGYGWKSFHADRSWRQDKGHRAEMAALIQCVTSGAQSPIPWHEIHEVTLASFDAVDIARTPGKLSPER
jgi:predicted dehydrogenase